jgi:hypothetical protein
MSRAQQQQAQTATSRHSLAATQPIPMSDDARALSAPARTRPVLDADPTLVLCLSSRSLVI